MNHSTRRWTRAVVNVLALSLFLLSYSASAAAPPPPTGKLPRWRDHSDMVFLAGGSFDYRGHDVRIRSFYIDKFEVTNEAYCRFLNDKHAEHWNADQEITRQGDRFVPRPDRARWPVYSVSWHDADTYARWTGKRLPTDAEWLWAAAGKEHRKYAWGNEPITPERANFGGNVGHPQPVGSHPAGNSPNGLSDLTGNVAEWCGDWFDPKTVPQQDSPSGPLEGDRKIRRAACYAMDATSQTNSEFAGPSPDYHPTCIGFRCVRPARRVLILLGENFAELELAGYTGVLSWAAHTNPEGNYVMPKTGAASVPCIEVVIAGFQPQVSGMGGTIIRPHVLADQLTDAELDQFDAVAVPACVGSGRGQHSYRGWEHIAGERAASIIGHVHRHGGVISTMCAGRCALEKAQLTGPETGPDVAVAYDPAQRTATSMGPAVTIEAACLLVQQLITPDQYRSFRRYNPWLFGDKDQFAPRVESLRRP